MIGAAILGECYISTQRVVTVLDLIKKFSLPKRMLDNLPKKEKTMKENREHLERILRQSEKWGKYALEILRKSK